MIILIENKARSNGDNILINIPIINLTIIPIVRLKESLVKTQRNKILIFSLFSTKLTYFFHSHIHVSFYVSCHLFLFHVLNIFLIAHTIRI